jgi:preprotein translocase subunit YajC
MAVFSRFSKIKVALLSLGIVSQASSVFAATAPSLSPSLSPSATQGPASAISSFFPLIILVVIVLFFFWSQRRRTKQMNQMISALSEGDEISMTNGLMGKVVSVGDQALTIEIAEGVNIKLQKNAVLQVLPKGTLKSV